MADERGQALVLVVLSMFVLIGVAALTIDVACWHAVQRRTQLAADAAALAAADCLGSNSCSYSTAATTAANQNGGGAVSVSTNAAGTQVTVGVANKPPTAFAGLAGISGPTVSRSAVAAPSVKTLTNPGTCATISTADCIAIFAGDACNQTAPTGYPLSTPGVYLDLGYTTNIAGTIVSNGGFNVNQQWNASFNWGFETSGAYYGSSASGCASGNLTSSYGWNSYGYNNEYLAGNGKNGTTSGVKVTPNQLPTTVQYPEYWGGWAGANASYVNETAPACTYTATTDHTFHYLYNISGLNYAYTDGFGNIFIYAAGTPSSYAAIPSGVFCAPTGGITLGGVYAQGDVTMIANSLGGLSSLVNVSSPLYMNLAPCGSGKYSNSDPSSCASSNALLMLQTGSSELMLADPSTNLQGTIFAPTAFLYADSIGSGSGFLEGAAVEYCAASLGNSFTISGTGPSASTLFGGSSLTG